MKDVQKITLKNGLRILLVKRSHTLAATVLILVGTGSEYETKRLSGVSHFLEHMMFKGTINRPEPGMIAHELAALGAQTNAFTSTEVTGYWAKVQATKFSEVLDIMCDLYLNPLFDENEIEKERGVILQEINMDEDDLPSRAYKAFKKLVYGDQPAGWDIAGEKQTVMKLGRKDFMAYRDQHYVMPATVVTVAGAFNSAAVQKQIETHFKEKKRSAIVHKKPTIERQGLPRMIVQFKESDQAHLVLGFRAFSVFDERRFALQVLSAILGSGMSSRLFMRIREQLGAAYYISTSRNLGLDHGLLTVLAGVDPARMDIVLHAILEECRLLSDMTVPEKELQKAKDSIVGNIVLGLETSDDLADYYGEGELLWGAPLSPETRIDRIKKITARDVQKVARDIFKDKGLNLSIVGPYKDEKKFKKLLTIEPV